MNQRRYTPPPWEEILPIAKEAISASEPVAVLTLDAETDPLLVALAAAARCRRLMTGLVALVENDLEDVMGVLLRSLYESWLVGTYAVIGGWPAVRRLLEHSDDERRKLAKVASEPVDDLPAGRPLPVSQLADMVTKLLKEESHEQAAFARVAYDALYRLESYQSTHGGLGSVIGYVADDDTSRRILAVRPEDDDGMRHRVLMGLSLLVSAAQMSARKAGLPHDRLNKIAQWILDLNPERRGTGSE